MRTARIPRRRRAPLGVLLMTAALLAGCASGGTRPVANRDSEVGHRAADIALSLRGSPYRYGASGPDAFDCSGLVQYAYDRAGLDVPRTARGQYDAVRRLYLYQLEPGDLVFFRTRGVMVSHVGIYIGNDRFVHAPKSRSDVHVSNLDERYWRSRLVRAGSLAH